MLTEREKWLMEQAWQAGFDSCSITPCKLNGFSDWLDSMAADAVTVEMVLEQEAPN